MTRNYFTLQKIALTFIKLAPMGFQPVRHTGKMPVPPRTFTVENFKSP